MRFSGQTVVVTGASGGIGAVFARTLSAAGAHVVTVARSADRLQQLADELEQAHPGARTEVVPLDLTAPDAGERLQERLAELGLQVDGLVNNAGMGTNGSFVGTPLERSLAQVDLDVRAVVELTGRFLPGMVERRSGWIVNISSTSAYQPVPGMATYAAAKAFIRSFNDALWFEAKPAGVRILGVAPGGVETGFFAAAGTEFLTKGRLTPEQVVDFALAHLDGTGPTVVPGLRNRFGTLGSRLVPRRLLIAVSAKIAAPAPRSDAGRAAASPARP